MNFSFEIDNLKCLPEFANLSLPDYMIEKIVSFSKPENNSLSFCKKWNDDIEEKYLQIKNSILIAKNGLNIHDEIYKNNFVIKTNNPRLLFAKVLNIIFDDFTLSIQKCITLLISTSSKAKMPLLEKTQRLNLMCLLIMMWKSVTVVLFNRE